MAYYAAYGQICLNVKTISSKLTNKTELNNFKTFYALLLVKLRYDHIKVDM